MWCGFLKGSGTRRFLKTWKKKTFHEDQHFRTTFFSPPEQELCQNCPSPVIFEWTAEGSQ
jgi:hypothetical protein